MYQIFLLPNLSANAPSIRAPKSVPVISTDCTRSALYAFSQIRFHYKTKQLQIIKSVCGYHYWPAMKYYHHHHYHYTDSRSSPNGHPCKRTALLMTAFTNPVFRNSQTTSVFLHFCIVASTSYGHPFNVLRVSTHESFHVMLVKMIQEFI